MSQSWAPKETLQQFGSDNFSGICPEALQAMTGANIGHQPAYGDDAWSERAIGSFRALFGAVRVPEGAFTYKCEVQPLPKIGPFKERLDALLAENEARPRRDRLRLTRIWDLLLRGFRSLYRCSDRVRGRGAAV